MSNYSLVTHSKFDDEGDPIPGTSTWQLTKNGEVFGPIFLTKKEALDALNGYDNSIEIKDY